MLGGRPRARILIEASTDGEWVARCLERAALQELPELALDELRQAHSIAGFRRRAQEGLQVTGDHLMELRVLGVSRAIHGRDTPHASGSAPLPA